MGLAKPNICIYWLQKQSQQYYDTMEHIAHFNTWEYTPGKGKTSEPNHHGFRFDCLMVYTGCLIRIPTMGYNKPYNKGWCDPLYDLNNQGFLLTWIYPLYFQANEDTLNFSKASKPLEPCLTSEVWEHLSWWRDPHLLKNAQVTNRLKNNESIWIQVSTKLLSKLHWRWHGFPEQTDGSLNW